MENNSLNIIAKKFSNELCSRYNEVKYEEISDVAEKNLQFLSDVNAGEEAINFLNDYIYFRISFNSNGKPSKN